MKYRIPCFKILGAALLISLLGADAAHATPITLNYSFTASGFTLSAGSGGAPPFDPVTGSFSLTFDNSANINNSSAVIASVSIPVTGSILFDYNSSFDRLTIGGSLNGASQVTAGVNDFFLNFVGASTAPSGLSFVYANQSNETLAIWGTANVVLTPAGATVPDTSSSLGLLALGVTALGLVRRKLATAQPWASA